MIRENLIEALLAGARDFNERELSELAHEYEINRRAGENRRWSRSVSNLIEVEGRTFVIDWEQGLTESQPDSYSNQPYEVKVEAKEVVTTQTFWNRI